jgi:hypothetical protein
MPGINWTRVVLGGLVAGLVMNIGEAALHGGVLGHDAEALAIKHQLAMPQGVGAIAPLVAMTFVLGTVSVWLYAAIRPRYGAGAKTALLAGLAVWVMAHLWSGIYLGVGLFGIVDVKLAYVPVVWGLVEAPLGTLAGAWMYREGA